MLLAHEVLLLLELTVLSMLALQQLLYDRGQALRDVGWDVHPAAVLLSDLAKLLLRALDRELIALSLRLGDLLLRRHGTAVWLHVGHTAASRLLLVWSLRMRVAHLRCLLRVSPTHLLRTGRTRLTHLLQVLHLPHLIHLLIHSLLRCGRLHPDLVCLLVIARLLRSNHRVLLGAELLLLLHSCCIDLLELLRSHVRHAAW